MTEKEPAETEKPAATTPEKETVTVDAKEYADIVATIKAQNKKIAAYKAREQNPKVNKSLETHTHDDKPEGIKVEKPHYVGSFQKYCPDCGDENPEFKDETMCLTCGGHTGAQEQAKDFKICPHCGAGKDQIVPFKPEAKCKDCGFVLGSKEYTQKLKGCPRCGSRSAVSM